ncbi:TetR/AcrR family transcriptional regulator [Algicola sagamiensis]|uniref:TetR/AcrR family transcriptional regulator n=1 Tax=Algicola sagamiensis TaxID=163869 RepID=UPI00039A0950|nr:TetR/AcrR family transcriptional regulator [Algicola sagamiensis]
MKRTQPTKLMILDAAEELFAESGFKDTSLRQITGRAGVNLASVNYHFGSKKELIQSVLERYLQVFMHRLNESFDALMNTASVKLHDVFTSFVEPLLALDEVRPKGATVFLQLLGRGYTDSQGHLRWYFATHYGEVLEKLVQLVKRTQPDLPDSEIFWRLHFTLGTFVFTMASSDALIEIAETDFDEAVSLQGLVNHVIPYIAAGVSAPVVGFKN